ncbi:hypothetical protein [Paramaledivibacter caminithermalis]|uniref:Uncharacterized protein n=1 Tax=Paramaledivibacter caminithermalis (strain DSM 15212 / CIP 107654 / DViRD3) TaxID=1121301 RepID=A0A1M6JV17_PARC5|nr:hypothetical protein [Paramaledivibacter caminithermalis]SHJ50537.1 hypothetical protein SAMN02745912_00169 [Paramaledivibacter caminithermalis DSM 15212]
MQNYKIQQYLADINGLKHYFIKDKFLYEESYLNSIVEQKIIGKYILKFSLDVDHNGNPHIACINDNKKIIHLKNNEKKWNKNTITEIQSFYKVKSIKLYAGLNNQTEAYILLLTQDIRNKNLYPLFLYSIKNSNWNVKKIADLNYDRYHPSLKSDTDNTGNLHIIFKTKENNKYKIYYKTYDAIHNKWSLSEKITESTEDITNTLLLCDTNNNINIVWCSLIDKNININFIRRKIDLYTKVKWKRFNTLPSNISNLTNPVLMQVGDNIKFGWKQSNFYNIIKTNIKKDDWKKSSSIKLSSSKFLIPLSIIGNKYKTIDPIKAPNTYFYLLDNNKKIIGINELHSIENTDKQKSVISIDKKNYAGPEENLKLDPSIFLDDIGKVIEKSTIVADIYANDNCKNQSNDLNSFIDKLNNLYKEIENVKSKELTLLNSILELSKKNNKIYRKIEEIINEYNG